MAARRRCCKRPPQPPPALLWGCCWLCVCVCVATRMGGSGRVVWLKGLLLTAAVALLVVVRCETDIDECASDPCRNNGTCTDRVAGYRCNCTANYTGVDCHVSVSGYEGCSAQVNDRWLAHRWLAASGHWGLIGCGLGGCWGSGGRVTNAVGTIFRKIVVGTRACPI